MTFSVPTRADTWVFLSDESKFEDSAIFKPTPTGSYPREILGNLRMPKTFLHFSKNIRNVWKLIGISQIS